MKTYCAISLFLLASIAFGQKVSDTTFVSNYGIGENIVLVKRWLNQIENIKSLDISSTTNSLVASFVWLKKTEFESPKDKSIIIADVHSKITFLFDGNNITTRFAAFNFTVNGVQVNEEIKNDIFHLSILQNNVEKAFREFDQFLKSNNPNQNVVIIEGIDILLKAENQLDIAVGLSLASGLVGSIVAANNPTAGLVITAIGGAVGLVAWIGSRINKRKGLKKLRGAA